MATTNPRERRRTPAHVLQRLAAAVPRLRTARGLRGHAAAHVAARSRRRCQDVEPSNSSSSDNDAGRQRAAATVRPPRRGRSRATGAPGATGTAVAGGERPAPSGVVGGRRRARRRAPTAPSRCRATRTRRRASRSAATTAARRTTASPPRRSTSRSACSTRRASSRRWPSSPAPASSDTPDDIKRTVDALAEYFNKRFQFYGRKIVIDFYNGQGSNTDELLGKGRDKAEADATTVPRRSGAFADLSATSEPYADALADRDVIGFGDPYLSRKWHDEHAPVHLEHRHRRHRRRQPRRRVRRQAALRRATPTHAGGDARRTSPASIATFAPENSWYQESVQVAARHVHEGRAASPGVERRSTSSTSARCRTRPPTSSPRCRARASPRSSAAATRSSRCSCPARPTREGYYPEFIIVGTALTDTDIVGQLWNQEFAKPRLRRELAHRAGAAARRRSATRRTRRCATTSPRSRVDLIYYQMYRWRSASRWPGPNLTPETFEEGMFAYPPQARPGGLVGLRPERLHGGRRRPRDLLGPERDLEVQRQAGRVRRAPTGQALPAGRDPRRRSRARPAVT